MIKINENIKSILPEIIILFLSFWVIAIFTVAWFSSNDKGSVDDIHFEVKDPDLLGTTIRAYSAIGRGSNNDIYFNAVEEKSISLGEYDRLSNNVHQVLLQFKLEKEMSNVSLKVKTLVDYFMGDGNHPLLNSDDGKGMYYNNSLSSIITFEIVSSPLIQKFAGNDAYLVIRNSNYQTFFDETTFEKKEDILLVDESITSEIWIVLDYSDKLIEKIIMENLDNYLISNENKSIVYINDFLFQIYKNKKE